MPAICAEHLLGRPRHHVLHVRARRAGEGDQHVGHGHVDLRLFLARRDQHGEQRRAAARPAPAAASARGSGRSAPGGRRCRGVGVSTGTSLTAPRRAPCRPARTGSAAMRSPAATPASTSTRPATAGPTRTARSTKPSGLRDVDRGQLAAAQHRLGRQARPRAAGLRPAGRETSTRRLWPGREPLRRRRAGRGAIRRSATPGRPRAAVRAPSAARVRPSGSCTCTCFAAATAAAREAGTCTTARMRPGS